MKAFLSSIAFMLAVTAGCTPAPKPWVDQSHEQSGSLVAFHKEVPSALLASAESSSAPTPSPTPAVAPTPMPSISAHAIHYRDKVVVLMYHHIAESEAGEEVTITPERFRKHLQTLKDNYYQVISIEDYVRFVKEDKPVPPNAVVITFDDGYESFYTYAYPLLKQYHYTATNFVIVHYIDSHYPSLPFLTWNQLVQMKKDGFSFYSHTFDLHQKLKGANGQLVPALANPIWLEGDNRLETQSEYRKRITDDLVYANQLLQEKLGNQLNILCFPYGYYNKTVVEVGNDIGIDFFFTTRDGINTRADKEIVRLHAGTRFVSNDKLLAKLKKLGEAKPAVAKSHK